MESGLWEGPVETNQQDDMEKQRKETIETHKVDFFGPLTLKTCWVHYQAICMYIFFHIIETNLYRIKQRYLNFRLKRKD